MKKTISILFAALIMISAFCSCEKNTTADDDGKTVTDAVTLSVWTTSDRLEITKQAVEKFKSENTAKTWDITLTAVDDVKNRIIGDPTETADVFCLPSEDFNDLCRSGALLKIDRDAAALKIRNTAESVIVASADDSLYAYPSSVDTLVMYYDVGKFNEDEVKQLETLLFKDLGEGNTNLSFDMSSSDVLTSFFLTAGCTLYGEDGNDTTKCDFNSAGGQAAAEYLVDLASNGKFMSADDEKIISAFSAGTLGGAIMSSKKYEQVKKALGDNFAVTRLPKVNVNDKDVPIKSVAKFEMYAVSSQSKNPESAMELADYLSAMDAQEMMADKNISPTNMALCAKEDLLNGNKLVNAVVEQAKDSVHEPTVEKITAYRTSAATFGSKISGKEYTKSDVASKLDAFVKEITD